MLTATAYAANDTTTLIAMAKRPPRRALNWDKGALGRIKAVYTRKATDDATTDDRTVTPNTKPTAPGQNYVKLQNGMLIYGQPGSEQV
jgi:hypothetical protein